MKSPNSGPTALFGRGNRYQYPSSATTNIENPRYANFQGNLPGVIFIERPYKPKLTAPRERCVNAFRLTARLGKRCSFVSGLGRGCISTQDHCSITSTQSAWIVISPKSPSKIMPLSVTPTLSSSPKLGRFSAVEKLPRK